MYQVNFSREIKYTWEVVPKIIVFNDTEIWLFPEEVSNG